MHYKAIASLIVLGCLPAAVVAGEAQSILEKTGANSADGEEFTLQSVSVWIDSSEYVPLRTKMDGIARSSGETRPITIERLDSDYRKVQGSGMYEPYRQVMRVSGVLSPEQQQEMREAQKQMAEMDQKLASMPEGQRQMITRGPEIKGKPGSPAE